MSVEFETTSVKMYESFNEKFGDKTTVFAEILTVKKIGLELLKSTLKPDSVAECLQDFSLIKSLDDAIIIALAHETKGEILYESLASKESDEAIKDLYFRLWATIINEYKKALKSISIQKNEKDEKSKSKAQANFLNLEALNELEGIKDSLEKLGSGDTKELENLLKNPNLSLFAGVAAGMLGSILVCQTLENFKKD